MMTPRCGNAAILMASEEFTLLDCGFCDDVIDMSDQELPELEPQPAWTMRSGSRSSCPLPAWP